MTYRIDCQHIPEATMIIFFVLGNKKPCHQIIQTKAKTKKAEDITLLELKEYEKEIKINDYIFDNELSHCIVNTYELKDWVVLNNLIGDKVKITIVFYPYERIYSID